MKIALRVLAGLVLVVGVCAGLYVGLWLLLIEGIAEVINAAKATPVDDGALAIGIVRAIIGTTVCSFIVSITFIISTSLFGFSFFKRGKK